jgi:ribokinase
MLEDSGENRILYVPGSTLAISADQVDAAFDERNPSLVLATLEPPAAALERLFARAARESVPVVFNATPEPFQGRQFAAGCDVLIVNETEATQLVQAVAGTDSWDAVASKLRAMGPSSVVITLGEEGAVLGTDAGVERFPAPRVTVVDTTGAGDSFCGALAAQLAAGRSIRDAVKYGVTAGALAVTKAGAQPSMPTLTEIEAMLIK